MQGASYKDREFEAAGRDQAYGDGQQLSAGEAALEIFKEYSREKPEIVAMWAFGVGFVLGWKLKFW